MLCKQFCLLVALAVASATAANISKNVNGGGSAGGSNSFGDIIRGQLTRNSVLIHTTQFVGPDFEWRGPNSISRFEVLDRSANNTLTNINIRGGLNDNFLQLWQEDGRPVNALVRIFSEPNNQEFGWRSPESVLLNTTRVTGIAPLDVVISGAFSVRYVEVDDRSNGTGSTVSVRNLDTNSATVRFRSELFRGRVDYNVRIFGERTTPNNHEFGNLTSASVLVTSQVITSANLTFFGSFTYRLTNHTFDYARISDLSSGTGGRVLSASHHNDVVDVQFERNANLHFLVQVYGTVRPPRDIIVGELQSGSVLLAEDIVNEWGTRASVVLQTDHPIDRIEVLNQDQNSRARATLITGVVGGRVVAVVFESDSTTWINYRVRVFGRRQ